MHPVDIGIHGRGAVATTLALALGQRGLRVWLSAAAAADPSRADVRAYALNAASRRLLQRLKVWDALPADAVTPVYDMHVRGDASAGRLKFSSWAQCVDALAWIVDAAELDSALNAALQFAAHVQRDSEPPGAALTVYAEGKDSASRAAMGVRFDRHSYEQTAIAARLTAEHPHDGVAHQWFRSPDVLALLPLDRPRAGCSFALVWSLPRERADSLMRADARAFEAELQGACADMPSGLQLASERSAWPLAIAAADPVCGAGWVLVGDAAHVVHPLAGQGLNLGFGDVQALADTLERREPWRCLGDERLLRRYARSRAWPVRSMSWLTDALVHGFASQHAAVRELRNRGMGLVDRAVPAKRWLVGQAIDG
ncbi:MAG TPA: FAD-dependent monooxygenase [Burkholderiaceae bacterium]|nr:FAD-dependent monooxygenase [Burkholderiaceae bacterium]